MSQQTLRSNGESAAHAYTWMSIPAPGQVPDIEVERVVVCDPRDAVTMVGPPQSSGPRNPAQRAPLVPKPPGIELPDNRPLSKAQRFWIDPELLVKWEREEAERRRGGV